MNLLYVAGLGRSGSTLLERALAQLPGVCGLGEVVFLWERGIANNERCGCGEPFLSCPFWHEVGQAAFGGWDQVDVDRITALRATVDDVKFVPRLLLSGGSGEFGTRLREYLEYYERLYAAARTVSGCSVIVDSSKFTSLAYILSHSERLDLSLVHILRDPRAVAYSWTKVVKRPEIAGQDVYMPRFSPAYMSSLYVGHHALLEVLRWRGVPGVRVRYEDFVERPIQELRRVASLGGFDVDERAVRGATDGTLRLETVHTVSGNPSRFQTGNVSLRRDEAWRAGMPRRQRALVTLMTAPSMLGYRYPVPLAVRDDDDQP